MINPGKRGDVSAFAETIRTNIARAESQSGTAVDPRTGSQLAHDAAVVAGVALCMASLKMLKILPGLPFASGYKTFLLFPLYVLAARLTHSRWGATAAGSIMGVIGPAGSATNATSIRGRTIRLFEHDTQQANIDLGDKGTSPGDRFIWSGDLFDRKGGKNVGRVGGNCETASTGAHAESVCTGNFILAGGQIIVQGISNTADLFGGKVNIFI